MITPTESDFGTDWRETLRNCTGRIFLLDLDGTVWSDILVVLNEEFGPTDKEGNKLWKTYDHAYKVAGTMSNGAHLRAEYRDLLATTSLETMIAWLRENHRLIPGVREFLQALCRYDISPVAISNGTRQIAEPMMAHHRLAMPLVANSLRLAADGTLLELDFVHDEHDAIRKGDLVASAVELGYEIVGCAGDSRGDIGMAEATARAGGLVLARGPGGLSDWCLQNEGRHLGSSGWLEIEDFRSIMPVLQARIGGF